MPDRLLKATCVASAALTFLYTEWPHGSPASTNVRVPTTGCCCLVAPSTDLMGTFYIIGSAVLVVHIKRRI